MLYRIQCTGCSVSCVQSTVFSFFQSFTDFFKVFSQKTPDLSGPSEPSPKFRSIYILLNFSFSQVFLEFFKVFFHLNLLQNLRGKWILLTPVRACSPGETLWSLVEIVKISASKMSVPSLFFKSLYCYTNENVKYVHKNSQ